MTTKTETILEAITRSEVYRNYECAYAETTGLPIAFRAMESCAPADRACRHENEFGMCQAAVPVRIGEQLIGFLETGQVLTKRPSMAHFKRSVRLAENRGVKLDRGECEQAYFHTRYLPRKQFEAMLQMLNVFAEHLGLIGNKLLVRRQNTEPPMIARAKEYIQQNHSEDLGLADVARVANTSTFYLCKQFKKSTGVNFTDYVSRVRIEKAKNLLLNPNLRISEIACEVGFQSWPIAYGLSCHAPAMNPIKRQPIEITDWTTSLMFPRITFRSIPTEPERPPTQSRLDTLSVAEVAACESLPPEAPAASSVVLSLKGFLAPVQSIAVEQNIDPSSLVNTSPHHAGFDHFSIFNSHSRSSYQTTVSLQT